MTDSTIQVFDEAPLLRIELNDPERRNALSVSMLDELIGILEGTAKRDDLRCVLLHGRGRSFCAGFDLGVVVDEPMRLDDLIQRLSMATRTMRRLPQVVVIAAQGAAIAGGCALLTGADAVFVEETTTAGYPVHALGVSPAVTIPTLRQATGDGRARELLLGGRLLKGPAMVEIGLATHLVPDGNAFDAAMNWAREAAQRSDNAMSTTKHWINELDGSNDDAAFNGPVAGSAELTGKDEAVDMLSAFWKQRNS